MDNTMMGMCGTYCGTCAWKERTGCPGCQSSQGHVFWGECRIAACSIERGLVHCGLCPELPCAMLEDAFKTPGHEDHGERLANLKNWAAGSDTMIELGAFKTSK